MFDYHIYGICFESDVALEMPRPANKEQPRFALRAADEPWPDMSPDAAIQEDADEWYAVRVYADGSVMMEWRDWLTFWIDPSGRDVRYLVNDAKYPRAFDAYVGNFAASACLLLQGEELLHSTVVLYNGRGLGFLGPSGAGKSTISAHLLGRGAELVTDDMLRITEHEGKLFAEPGLPRLKLFLETATQHLPHALNKGQWNPLSEKYLYDFASPSDLRDREPLHALLTLAPPHEEAPDEIILHKLEGLKLFESLTSSTMNYRLQTPERLARQFSFATRLAGQLPVYALHYPRRHDIFPAIVRAIEDTVLST